MQASRSLGSRRILVVEDDLAVCETLAGLLRGMGHEVEFAISGYAALEVAARFRPEIVILDLGLPDIDGCAVAAGLRSLVGLEAVHIVVVSGRGLPGDHERSLSAGCDDYFVKPLHPVILEAVLQEAAGAL
jgi:two-component system, chemotaxis family, CheB/CheR fusion protein